MGWVFVSSQIGLGILGVAILVLALSIYFFRNRIKRAGSWIKSTFFTGKYSTLRFGMFLTVSGIFLLLHFDPKYLFWKVVFAGVTEIGFAFIIAWVVGSTVEKSAKREYNEYIQKKEQIISQNVFAYLYNINMPRPVFDMIEKYILKNPIIKTTQLLEYKLFDPEEGSKWILMQCRFDYVLKNVSEEEQKITIPFHASKVSGLDVPNNGKDGLKYLNVDGVEVDASKFDELDKSADDAIGQQRFAFPCVLAAKQEIRVILSFLQYKRVDDNDLFQSTFICEKTEATVRFNPSVFNVFMEPIHPSNIFAADFEEKEADEILCKRVRIEEPLLPKNGVFFWWNLKEAPKLIEN